MKQQHNKEARMKAVLYCGDRNWNDTEPIRKSFDRESPDLVVHGAARGADSLAGREAGLRDIPVNEFEAEWEVYGRAAGHIRNDNQLRFLLDLKLQGWEVKVVAFHSDIANSKGTKDMVTRAEKAGVEVEVVI